VGWLLQLDAVGLATHASGRCVCCWAEPVPVQLVWVSGGWLFGAPASPRRIGVAQRVQHCWCSCGRLVCGGLCPCFVACEVPCCMGLCCSMGGGKLLSLQAPQWAAGVAPAFAFHSLCFWGERWTACLLYSSTYCSLASCAVNTCEGSSQKSSLFVCGWLGMAGGWEYAWCTAAG
jgi:hypothetical protein